MSKFYAGSSGSESDSDVSIQETQNKAQTAQQFYDSSSDDDNVKRKVVSEKEKRFGELKGNVQKLNNSVKINDYGKCLDDFNDLTKNIDKAKKALDAVDNQLPTFVLSSLHKLDTAVVKAWPDRKKLNRAQGQALTKMKQRIKKYFEEPNKDIFKAQLEKYQENPVSSEKQETSESSESDDEPIATTARDILQNTKKKVTTKSRFEGMRRLFES